jgi:hypothetical protein
LELREEIFQEMIADSRGQPVVVLGHPVIPPGPMMVLVVGRGMNEQAAVRADENFEGLPSAVPLKFFKYLIT